MPVVPTNLRKFLSGARKEGGWGESALPQQYVPRPWSMPWVMDESHSLPPKYTPSILQLANLLPPFKARLGCCLSGLASPQTCEI